MPGVSKVLAPIFLRAKMFTRACSCDSGLKPKGFNQGLFFGACCVVWFILLVLLVDVLLQANAQKIVDAAHVICPCVCAEPAPASGV